MLARVKRTSIRLVLLKIFRGLEWVVNRRLSIISKSPLWADTVEKLDNLNWGFLRRNPICFEFHLLLGIRVQRCHRNEEIAINMIPSVY